MDTPQNRTAGLLLLTAALGGVVGEGGGATAALKRAAAEGHIVGASEAVLAPAAVRLSEALAEPGLLMAEDLTLCEVRGGGGGGESWLRPFARPPTHPPTHPPHTPPTDTQALLDACTAMVNRAPAACSKLREFGASGEESFGAASHTCSRLLRALVQIQGNAEVSPFNDPELSIAEGVCFEFEGPGLGTVHG